jgi:hypothetical protein
LSFRDFITDDWFTDRPLSMVDHVLDKMVDDRPEPLGFRIVAHHQGRNLDLVSEVVLEQSVHASRPIGL